MSFTRTYRAARWLSYTLGVLIFSGQPVIATTPQMTAVPQLATPQAVAALPADTAATPSATETAATAQEMAHLSEAEQLIPNMSSVEPNFYRGGQPDYLALQQLKQAGVKVDVSLENGSSIGERRYVEREAQEAQALGIKFVNIPMNPIHRPSDQDILRFLDIVDKKDNEPMFVHCMHGRDRTSAMVACYRVLRERWTPDAAYREMLDRGFRPFFTALSDTVFDVGRNLGMIGHRPTLGFIATHLAGHINRNMQLAQ